MKIVPVHNLSQGEKTHRLMEYKIRGKLKEVEKLFKRIQDNQYSNTRFKNYKVTIDNRWVVITLINDKSKRSYYRDYQSRMLFDDLFKPGRIKNIMLDVAESLVSHEDWVSERIR